MTEAQWLLIRSPAVLLDGVRGEQPKHSTRKLRLYICACSRWVPDFASAERLPEAVEIIEAFADGLVELDQLNLCRGSFVPSGHHDVRGRLWRLTRCVLSGNNLLWDAAKQVANVAVEVRVVAALGPKAPERAAEWEAREQAERAHLCPFVRDIFGNPFRPIALDPARRTPTVTALATAAYEERQLPAGTLDPDRLAVLSDALEDAGCDSGDILSHLRGPGPHVRGCWVIDLLLGKE
jgi:hypothetical protein